MCVSSLFLPQRSKWYTVRAFSPKFTSAGEGSFASTACISSYGMNNLSTAHSYSIVIPCRGAVKTSKGGRNING